MFTIVNNLFPVLVENKRKRDQAFKFSVVMSISAGLCLYYSRFCFRLIEPAGSECIYELLLNYRSKHFLPIQSGQ